MYKLCLIPDKFIKKYIILNIVFGEVGWGRSQQEADQAVLHKGDTGYLKCITDPAHINIGTDNSSLLKGKGQLPRKQNLNSFKGLTLAPDQTAKSTPGQGHRTRFFHRSLWESLGLAGSQQIMCMCVPVCKGAGTWGGQRSAPDPLELGLQ